MVRSPISGYGALLRIAILTCLFTLALAGTASAQDDPIFTVTAPSGVEYTASRAEFDHWLDVARASSGGSPGRAERAAVFALLTRFAWIEGEAGEQGITVTQEAAVRELRVQRRQTFPSLRAWRRF